MKLQLGGIPLHRELGGQDAREIFGRDLHANCFARRSHLLRGLEEKTIAERLGFKVCADRQSGQQQADESVEIFDVHGNDFFVDDTKVPPHFSPNEVQILGLIEMKNPTWLAGLW